MELIQPDLVERYLSYSSVKTTERNKNEAILGQINTTFSLEDYI